MKGINKKGPAQESARQAFILGQIIARKQAEKTVQRYEEKLQQSEKIMALGRLAGGVAHDFNNLLTAILGYARLARSRLPAEDEIAEDIDEVVRAGERAVELTSQLLALTRKKAGQVRPISINGVIRETDRLLRRTLGADIEISCLLDDNLGGVAIDPGQLQQIIMNFAINARDAMPDGGKLTISTSRINLTGSEHADLKPGEYVTISVKDSGCGIPRHIQERIFEPFFTTKEKGKGSGLGLSTAHQIIAAHGGFIRIHSQQEQGTEFIVYFPSQDSLRAEVLDELETMTPAGTETVLVVEDEPSVRQFAVKALEKLGYQVLEAGTGQEAVSLFDKTEKIDLVLTDIVMPLMNGRELIELLAERGKPFRALYMSGFCQDMFLQGPPELMMIPLLRKPYSQGKLARAVRQVLDAEQRAQLPCVE
jgi:nitrogen-specific signal transduction histidine kinase